MPVKHPGAGLKAPDPDNPPFGVVEYERQRYRLSDGSGTVSVYVFNPPEGYELRIDKDPHDASAFE